MSELENLKARQQELLNKIQEIGEQYEGIENEHNAQKIQELNKVQAQLIGNQNNLKQQLQSVQEKLKTINNEIDKLSSTATDRILEAIKNQRWYFFKNKPHILMDKTTGILWANLDYFPYAEGSDKNGWYKLDEAKSLVDNYSVDGIDDWQIPTFEVFKQMIYDKTFPFQKGEMWEIKDKSNWYCLSCTSIQLYNIQEKIMYEKIRDNKFSLLRDPLFGDYRENAHILPCSYHLLKNSKYEKIYRKIIHCIQKKKDYNSLWTYLKKMDFCLYLMMLKSLIYTRKSILKSRDYYKH